MEIRIFGLADDSIVDGPGVRYTVFVQGCPHHCPGCHNPASHDFAGGTLMDTDGIIRKIGENPLLDGVTLSGGEPMCQPEACRTIADAAHAKQLNVWCYTGFTLDALLKDPKALGDILKYHVVSGKVLAAEVAKHSSVKTLLGQDAPIKLDGGKVAIAGAQIILTDIETSNGVIHVIDSVMLPK